MRGAGDGGRLLAEGGFRGLFAEFSPAVALHGRRLRVHQRTRAQFVLEGRGLLLVPSAFIWPQIATMIAPPWPPALIYPARGVGGLWHEPAAEGDPMLAKLIGSTRASILAALAEPGRSRRSPSSVSGVWRSR